MEWVETTGPTVDDAKDAALDELGVDEQDAEFEVLEEPRTGLFGRTRGEARVRARVRPTQPRPKVERRERRGKSGGRPARGPRRPKGDAPDKASTVATSTSSEAAAPKKAPRPPARQRPPRDDAPKRPTNDHHDDDDQERSDMSETELAEQGELVREFLVDLLDAFGLDGQVTAAPADDDAVELNVTGGDLGLLIGPKGGTLQAIQELSRSVLQRQLPGTTHARIRVDVSGYRARRRVALEGFVRQVALDVLAAGEQKALEPMSPPDRKVVHDTVNEIEGVHTISEGEDARRRVVIIPDD